MCDSLELTRTKLTVRHLAEHFDRESRNSLHKCLKEVVAYLENRASREDETASYLERKAKNVLRKPQSVSIIDAASVVEIRKSLKT